MLHRLIRPLIFLAASVLTVLVGARISYAGNVEETSGIQINDPSNPYDDQYVTYRQRWDSSAEPVKFYLYRDPIAHNVLDSQIYDPGPTSPFNPSNVLSSLQESLGAWNGNSFSDFAFNPLLSWSDEAAPRLGANGAFYFPSHTALDGINLITFQDDSPFGGLANGIIGVTNFFYLNQDWDLTKPSSAGVFPIVVITNDAGVAQVDFDGDGNYDLILPARKYKQGEIIDADVTFNTSETDFQVLPDDPKDLTVPYQSILGTVDIQATLTHELGHCHGLAHANIFAATMTPFLNTTLPGFQQPGGGTTLNVGVDPYKQRQPQLDDFISQALQYPKSLPSNLGAISGEVLDGDAMDPALAGTSNPYVLQVPVYVTVPDYDLHPENDPDSTIYTQFQGAYNNTAATTAVATFNDQPGAERVPFKRLASSTTGIDETLYLYGSDAQNGPVSQGTLDAPTMTVNSNFYLTGLPIADNYALFTDNPELTNVSDVMSNSAPLNTPFSPEFYGGANFPAPGYGDATPNVNTGDDLFSNNYIECAIDPMGRFSAGVMTGQGTAGIPLIDGHPIPERGYASFKIDGQTTDMHDTMAGTVLNGMTIDDVAKRALARWKIPHGTGQLTQPISIAFKNDGKAYIGDAASNTVQRYNAATGLFEATFASQNINRPSAMFFDNKGRLYVASENSNQILRFNATTGTFLDVFVNGTGGLKQPRGMLLTNNGDLLVCSYGTNQILRYAGPNAATPGAFLGVFVGDNPATPDVDESGGLQGPSTMAVDLDGNLEVTSTGTNSVMRYFGPNNGNLTPGLPRGLAGNPSDATLFAGNGLSGPIGLVLTEAGKGLVASSGSNAVLEYECRTGVFDEQFVQPGEEGLSKPGMIYFGAQDNYLYACSTGNNRIMRFNENTGTYVDSFSTPQGDIIMTMMANLSNAGGANLEGSYAKAPDDVSVSYQFQNDSATSATIELRLTEDLAIGGKNNPLYFINQQQVTHAGQYTGANVPKYLVFQDSKYKPVSKGVLSLTGAGTGSVAPNKLVIDDIDNIMGSTFDFSPSSTDLTTNADTLDSGVAIFFGPVTVGPGQSTNFGSLIGSLLDDPPRVLVDGPFGATPAAAGTEWYEDPGVAERIATLPGQVIDGNTIITDTGAAVPGFIVPSSGTPPGAMFTLNDDLIPNGISTSQGGVAFDMDNDGDLDLCLIGGGNQGGQPSFNRLLQNRLIEDGHLKFLDVTFGPSGVPGMPDNALPPNPELSQGVCAADFNNDGYEDLFFSNSDGPGIPGEDRLYLNRGDGTFEDVTEMQPLPSVTVVPGEEDQDTPDFMSDASMRPTAGDIDSDGDIDIVIPLWGEAYEGLPDGNGAQPGFYQDIVYQTNQVPPQSNYDGLYYQVPKTGGVKPFVDEARAGAAMAPCRVLVNQLRETGVLYFLDDTLGRDHTFGGFQPVGGVLHPENLDRMPPLLPGFGAGFNAERPLGTEALLANFVGDASLDLLVSESTFNGAEAVANQKTQASLRLYNNIDVNGDLRPDGYFAQVNYGTDFTLYPTTAGPVQADFCPYFIGIPDGYPSAAGPLPVAANEPDLFPETQNSINAVTVADIANEGIPNPITACTSINSYYFPRKYADVTTVNNKLGSNHGRQGTIYGEACDFELQLPGYEMTLPTLCDRWLGGVTVDEPFPTPAQATSGVLLNPGDDTDEAEETPSDGSTGTGQLLYDVPFTVGRWTSAAVPTGYVQDGSGAVKSGNKRTRDVVAADFNRDGYPDLFYANDNVGNDGIVAEDPVTNNLYINNGDGTFTDDSQVGLVLEPAAPSAAAIVGDFNNDGAPDLYVCNPGGQDHLLLNTTFSAPPDLTSTADAPLFYDDTVDYLPGYFAETAMNDNMTTSLAVADMNGDGRMDLYVGNGGMTSAPFGAHNDLFFNSGEPQAPGTKVMRPMTSPYPAPAIIQNNPFDWTYTFENEQTATTGVAVGDLDNDGDYDLVDVNYQQGPRWFSNEHTDDPLHTSMPQPGNLGDGYMMEQTIGPIDNPSCGLTGVPDINKNTNTCVALGDFDGDGRLDMIIGNGSANTGSPDVLLMNTVVGGATTFQDVSETGRLPRVKYVTMVGGHEVDCIESVPDDAHGVVVGDFNGDGHVDIFLANTPIPDTVASLRMQADKRPDGLIGSRLLINHQDPATGQWGFFVDETQQRLPASFLSKEASLPVAGCVKIGDFNNSGERSEDINYNGVLDPGFDLDGDGRLENGEDSFFSYLSANRGSVIPDNGKLDFIDTNGNGVADLNLDIFIGYQNSSNVLLMNDGTGHFTDASNNLPDNGLSISTISADVGDVDLDGNLDIVLGLNVDNLPVTNPPPSPVALLHNDGNASFTDISYEIPFPASILDPGSQWMGEAGDVKLVDLDNDGDLDLVVGLRGNTESTDKFGYLNYVMINRLIGANWNAERTTVAQIPGQPILRVISPPGAVPGSALDVQITGANMPSGSTFDFGPGITVVGPPVFTDQTKALVHLSIDGAAAIGPRTVKITTPGGTQVLSRLGAFSVLSQPITHPGTAVHDGAWMLYETATPDNIKPNAAPMPKARKIGKTVTMYQ